MIFVCWGLSLKPETFWYYVLACDSLFYGFHLRMREDCDLRNVKCTFYFLSVVNAHNKLHYEKTATVKIINFL